MPNVDLLRQVRARQPQMAERIIAAWGSAALPRVIGELLRTVLQDTDADAGARAALQQLKDDHAREYPQWAEDDAGGVSDEVILNEHFRVINARFPHIGRELVRHWATAALAEYVNHLLNDTRDGQRRGFPTEIVLALWRLMQDHDTAHPELQLKVIDIWALNDPT